jgi:hypothetical protein
MGYASWVTPNKTTGSGTDSVIWTGQEHTGRNARSTQAIFSGTGVDSKTLTINQSGKTEFVSIDATASVQQAGGNITISGTSNSSKLTFALTGTNGIGLSLPSTYSANTATTSSGAAIAGDPGANQQFTFTITFSNIGTNTGSSTRQSTLRVTDNGGHTADCTITQLAGAASLSISPTTITLAATAGSTATVTVTSNISWSIS